MKHSREKCAEAGREARRIQREYLREVAGEMKSALEAAIKTASFEHHAARLWHEEARKALEKASRLGL